MPVLNIFQIMIHCSGENKGEAVGVREASRKGGNIWVSLIEKDENLTLWREVSLAGNSAPIWVLLIMSRRF